MSSTSTHWHVCRFSFFCRPRKSFVSHRKVSDGYLFFCEGFFLQTCPPVNGSHCVNDKLPGGSGGVSLRRALEWSKGGLLIVQRNPACACDVIRGSSQSLTSFNSLSSRHRQNKTTIWMIFKFVTHSGSFSQYNDALVRPSFFMSLQPTTKMFCAFHSKPWRKHQPLSLEYGVIVSCQTFSPEVS